MHIPMARDEISRFLEMSSRQVDWLWSTGRLQRTWYCEDRPAGKFCCSTIYDVLEYALFSGDLPIRLSKEKAALWVFQLAELEESGEYELSAWRERAAALLEAAVEDGITRFSYEAQKTAAVVTVTHLALISLCYQDGGKQSCLGSVISLATS